MYICLRLSDPDFCTKVKKGRLSNIKYCIGCDQGCYDYFVNPEKPHISCLRNPAVGKEAEYEIVKTEEPKRVMIIGGGVGGLEAADILHDRGHVPAIYEKTGALGGQFLLAGRAPRKDDTYRAVKLFAQNAVDFGVEIHLNTEVTPELIKEVAPDAVIIACGSDPVIPKIPGYDSKSVVEARKLLGSDDVKCSKAVVIGGGVVVESADGESFIEAEMIVLAIGSRPRTTDALVETCNELGIDSYVVGDAVAAPRLALNAIEEAFKAAFAI